MEIKNTGPFSLIIPGDYEAYALLGITIYIQYCDSRWKTN